VGGLVDAWNYAWPVGGGKYECFGKRDANIELLVGEADLQAVPAGRYTGTLTLTLTPQ